MTPTVRETLRQGARRLDDASIAEPALEASILLAHVLNKTRSWLFAWPETTVNDGERVRFDRLLDRRCQGEPIAHLVGEREFWSLPLQVSPDTLIPRPETELAVERTLALLPAIDERLVADLGTGSGAIAAALARERPEWRIIAVDRSEPALTMAARNFARLGLTRVLPVLCEWLAPFHAGCFDLIVSNPPYVAQSDPHLLEGDVRFEPTLALTAGPDGLDALRTIIRDAPRNLKPGGWLILEHGWNQAAQVRDLLALAGFSHIATYQDLAGNDRVSEGCCLPESLKGGAAGGSDPA